MKIVILDGYTENPGDLSWEQLGKLGELTVYDRTPVELVAQRIKGYELVLTNKTLLSRDVILGSSSLRYIGVLATGYNVVDLAAAREKGVVVTNIPSYGSAAVGQFAIALLLEICHHIGHHDQAVHQGKWSQSTDFCFWDYPSIELEGKTMGIVGYGRIGRKTAAVAQALGMDVVAYNPSAVEGPVRFVSLPELYRVSDVIALHCPLTEKNARMINRESIARMKDGVILINNSRGGLVDEQDLADALNSGKVYAAGVDVVSSEPISPDNPLLKAKNCIITPHISWAPKETRQRLMDIAVDNVRAFLQGKPVNRVDE
ncbi:MAG: D-2-hydroxyacid dehydrogenase [Sphaerochaeta sp.]|jgi:glycerate dehydrogenase|nr:D-2-hydroxyacid dehydrogenase [Sphaerochaeta sp.]MCH3919940.1 D-2-hydroxyacid dehydrogenase [Sphaerochaeta sp.]MCI2097695.1 D-2-hydroxyacid dehydrogenase [Sphaerochaeta sp.]MCI2104037.1 D-2-hydroxyacid dehydrogenase [Sphaerochaeta sp.]MCI2128123.1 D-2-hydroxyacid dehydrogenase [Sphaerochaeta sp.]